MEVQMAGEVTCDVCGGDGVSKAWGSLGVAAQSVIGDAALVCARCKGKGVMPASYQSAATAARLTGDKNGATILQNGGGAV